MTDRNIRRLIVGVIIAIALIAAVRAQQPPTACRSAASDESSYLGQLFLTMEGLPDFSVTIVTNAGRDGHAMPVERRVVHLRDYAPWVKVKADIRARAEAKRAEAMRGQAPR